MLQKTLNMLGSKNVLEKAIKHIIEQEKAIKRKGCGLQLNSYIHTPKPQIQGMETRRGRFLATIHTPKPQIQGMETRRGRLGARILPCNCGEKRRIKGVQMCLGVFRREIGERRERIYPGNCQKSYFLCKMRGLEAFIVQN